MSNLNQDHNQNLSQNFSQDQNCHHQGQNPNGVQQKFMLNTPQTSNLYQLPPTHILPIQQSPIRVPGIPSTTSPFYLPQRPPSSKHSDNFRPNLQYEYPPPLHLPPTMHSYPMLHLPHTNPAQPTSNYYIDQYNANPLQYVPITQQSVDILPPQQQFSHIQQQPYSILNYPLQQPQLYYQQSYCPKQRSPFEFNSSKSTLDQTQNPPLPLSPQSLPPQQQKRQQKQSILSMDPERSLEPSNSLPLKNNFSSGLKKLETKLSKSITTECSKIEKPAHRNSSSMSTSRRNSLSYINNNSNNDNIDNIGSSCLNAVNDYLNYHSFSINLSKRLVWTSSITDELIKFSKYIGENNTLNSFLEKEANISSNEDLTNEILNSNYKIEEFYNYIESFSMNDLNNLFNIFEKLSLMVKDWIAIKESKNIKDLSINHFLNTYNKSANNTNNVSNNNNYSKCNSVNNSNLNLKISVTPNSIPTSNSTPNSNKSSLKFYKSSNIPGESVSLQVVPFKPVENQDSNIAFNSHGTLQPDLALKVKLVCLHCGSTSTPEWRKGPDDAKTLCNACGLFHTKLVKKIGSIRAAQELRKRRENGEQNNRRI